MTLAHTSTCQTVNLCVNNPTDMTDKIWRKTRSITCIYTGPLSSNVVGEIWEPRMLQCFKSRELYLKTKKYCYNYVMNNCCSMVNLQYFTTAVTNTQKQVWKAITRESFCVVWINTEYLTLYCSQLQLWPRYWGTQGDREILHRAKYSLG